MNLADCRFTHAGRDIRFTVYSDARVETKLEAVVTMPLVGQAEVYRLEPCQTAQWVSVSVLIRTGEKEQWRSWSRRNGQLIEVTDAPTLAWIREQVESLRHRKPIRRSLAA